MRSFIIAVLFAGACAHSTPGASEPVNVAVVRNQINGTITAESGGARSIHSMGKTRADRAVVYTTSKSGEQQEETWVKVDGKWRLETKTALKTGA